jgi:hemerythrin-like domain-containing protein
MDESEKDGGLPDFALLELALFYIRKFPEAQRHPKEDQYLFDCLRKRTHDADETLAVLQRHHADRSLLDELAKALAAYKAGQDGARSRFALALEERTILPAARKHLAKEDWVRIAAAFGENNTPGPDNVADGLFKEIFSRLMRNASPAGRLATVAAE